MDESFLVTYNPDLFLAFIATDDCSGLKYGNKDPIVEKYAKKAIIKKIVIRDGIGMLTLKSSKNQTNI